MKFVVIGRDDNDALALDRRLSRRQAHIERLSSYQDQGIIEYAVGLKDEKDNLVGSILVFDCDSKEYVLNWLKEEPYIEGNVWKDVEIFEGSIPVMPLE